MVNSLVAVPAQRAVLRRSWRWSQRWQEVLFLHWCVPVADLQNHVPAPLTLDTIAGEAWVSLVLFRLRVRPRWLPFIPGLSNLVEVNLRTYVRWREQPGIWFLSVHADNRWAIRLARWLTPLPYVRMPMCYQHTARQLHFSAPHLGLTCDLQSQTAVLPTELLDDWLLERYRLYAQTERWQLLCADVEHPSWQTQTVTVSEFENRLGLPFGLDLNRVPELAHYSPGLAAKFGAFRQPTAKDTLPCPG